MVRRLIRKSEIRVRYSSPKARFEYIFKVKIILSDAHNKLFNEVETLPAVGTEITCLGGCGYRVRDGVWVRVSSLRDSFSVLLRP